MNKRTLAILIAGYTLALMALWGGLIHFYTSHTAMFQSASDRHPGVLIMLMMMGILAVFMLILVVGIGCYVHADARKRGMNPLPWTLIAVFVPYFIGLIVYLLTRKPLQTGCPSCGMIIAEEAAFCPQCGHALRRQCPACQAMLDSAHRFCPKCGAKAGSAQ
jgi:RNA polymerase subunit RPABC4/transcription elongation factor Spt4